jgi:hypothetical protein
VVSHRRRHPTPDEPGYDDAEMLYIDPRA